MAYIKQERQTKLTISLLKNLNMKNLKNIVLKRNKILITREVYNCPIQGLKTPILCMADIHAPYCLDPDDIKDTYLIATQDIKEPFRVFILGDLINYGSKYSNGIEDSEAKSQLEYRDTLECCDKIFKFIPPKITSLLLGNHDKRGDLDFLRRKGIEVVEGVIIEGNTVFQHEPDEKIKPSKYIKTIVSAHTHKSVPPRYFTNFVDNKVCETCKISLGSLTHPNFFYKSEKAARKWTKDMTLIENGLITIFTISYMTEPKGNIYIYENKK